MPSWNPNHPSNSIQAHRGDEDLTTFAQFSCPAEPAITTTSGLVTQSPILT